MAMKRLFANAAQTGWFRTGLAALVVLLGVAALRPATAGEERPYGQGLLWRVEKPGEPASYVYGTMHSADERIVDLPEPVAQAFAESEAVVLELVMGGDSAAQLTQALVLTDGSVLPDIVGDERFARITEIGTRYGMAPAQLQLFRPWAVMTFFSVPPQEMVRQAQGNLPLDQALQAQAQALDKEVEGLETISEQLAVFGELSPEDQIALLDVALDLNPQIEALYEDMKRAYLAGDLDGLHEMADRQSAGADPELTALFEDRLIDTRNRLMVERMADRLAQGKAFVAVGALHLSGETGILNLLADQGYSVTRVY